MDGIDRLARQWHHLSEEARAYHWQKLGEGERAALQNALREKPAGRHPGRGARANPFLVIVLLIAALAVAGLWVATPGPNSSPGVRDYYRD